MHDVNLKRVNLFALLCLLACPAISRAAASPVWVAGRSHEMNGMYGFRGDFTARSGDRAVLKIAGCSLYRIFVNGEFAGYGPARGPKGYFRDDEWDLSRFVKDGANAVAIEVSAYNIGTYYVQDHFPFVEAEVLVEGKSALSTPNGFRAVGLPRVTKCSRYSFQRGFGEVWRLANPSAAGWRTGKLGETLPLETCPAVRHLPRIAPYPEFRKLPLARAADTKVAFNADGTVKKRPYNDFIALRSLRRDGSVNGYPPALLDFNVYSYNQLVKTLSVTPSKVSDRALRLSDGTGAILDVGHNASGFFGARVVVTKPCRLGFMFDEMLTTNGTVAASRFSVANGFYYDFDEPGEYAIENFESNTFRWLHVFAFGGAATVEAPYLREYKTPAANAYRFACDDAELKRIFEAGRETFAQNAVDVFTDCPQRERAGWLCDSWFTAHSSYLLTGSTALEDLFISNYALADGFDDIDEGMLPMCYPSDHDNGNYIPNWAMWFVLQVDDYANKRHGDRKIVERLRPRLVKFVEFMKRYRNSDGLLEKLPKWVFVEWSRANHLVQDVNYPSNMTWAETLDAMDRLYGMPELAQEAAKVRETVRRQSWTGEWFCDNAVRQKDGTLKLSGECTETCQYYAFFFKTATPESHPVLWKRLVEDFGPVRMKANSGKDPWRTMELAKDCKWSNIWPANAFIGNYMRLEILSRAGLGDRVVEDIRGYFLEMADSTGTLWENITPTASCCHGFASYVTVLLARHARR